MRRSDLVFLGLGGALLLAGAIPVIASGPESLLPPGFGEQEPAPPPAAGPPAADTQQGQLTQPNTPPPQAGNILPPLPSETSTTETAAANAAEPEQYDLPPEARQSLTRVGPLDATNGGVSPQAFGQVRGQFLAGLMRTAHAPFVSRWEQILLRRVLLSGIDTPGDIDGANLAAERAALLLRMGEADAARMIVQSVDIDDYTPRLYDVAMQSYLATADPGGFCALLPAALDATHDPHWQIAQAICASFSGEQGMATSFLNQAQGQGKIHGVDYRLAEKAVGAGPNSRRSVKIEWQGVDTLDPWRFGLATATNVDIPDALYQTGGDRFRAWEARAPMLSVARRLPGVAAASRLGVFSGAALIDFYSQLSTPETATTDEDKATPAGLFDTFRACYAGDTVAARIDAMRTFWTMAPADGSAPGPGKVSYAALPAIARAAAALPPTSNAGENLPWLIAAMLSGGYDHNAANWSPIVDKADGAGKERAWALLAVGLPDTAAVNRAKVDAFISADDSENKIASQMLVASLAGLGRISGDDVNALAQELSMNRAVPHRWARELSNAAARREKGTVALLAAIGLQSDQWALIPPGHVIAILSAMRQVGLEPEARMIAAEAVTRL
jgi:hypothetical protein